MIEQICGTCNYHEKDIERNEDWLCVCGPSDYCGDYTQYRDSCEEWEEREYSE